MNPCILCGTDIAKCPAWGTWHRCGGYIRVCAECTKGDANAKVKAIVVHERECR